VLFALDVALCAFDRRARWASWARRFAVTLMVVAAGECALAIAAFARLPHAVALDVLWPAYFVNTYPPAAARWPDLTNWRLVAGQYLNPLAGLALSAAALTRLWRRRADAAEDPRWALLLLPALYGVGAFTFFRTDHHFRQFAWMLVFGAAAAIVERRRFVAVALVGWLPVASVVAASVVRPSDATREVIVTPNGWRLSLGTAERGRVDGIVSAIREIDADAPGPVLFYPNGTGLFVAYGMSHVSRENWFYRIALRPYELQTLNREYSRVTALVECGAMENMPDEIREPLERRIAARIWTDRECTVYRLAASSADK